MQLLEIDHRDIIHSLTYSCKQDLAGPHANSLCSSDAKYECLTSATQAETETEQTWLPL